MKRLAILAIALGTSVVAPMAASAQMYPHFHHGQRRAVGRIVNVQGSSFRLDSGRVVFLKQGTVINPTGLRLRPGMRVSVMGSGAGDHNINAQVVNLLHRY